MDTAVIMILLFSMFSFFKNGHVHSSSRVWKFGHDSGGTNKVEYIRGDIYSYEKVKRIPLQVHPNYVVVFVEVEISNPYSQPHVSFDNRTGSAIIAYQRRQYSASTYQVLVKSSLRHLHPHTNLDYAAQHFSADYYGY